MKKPKPTDKRPLVRTGVATSDKPLVRVREAVIERKIRAFAESAGITMEKQSGPGNRGKADQRVEWDGRCGFMEIKRPGEKPTKLQLRYLQQKRNNGFLAIWVDNAEDGIKWLTENFT